MEIIRRANDAQGEVFTDDDRFGEPLPRLDPRVSQTARRPHLSAPAMSRTFKLTVSQAWHPRLDADPASIAGSGNA